MLQALETCVVPIKLVSPHNSSWLVCWGTPVYAACGAAVSKDVLEMTNPPKMLTLVNQGVTGGCYSWAEYMPSKVCSQLWETFTWNIEMPAFTWSRKGARVPQPAFDTMKWLTHGRRQLLLPALPPLSLPHVMCREAVMEQKPWRARSMLSWFSVISLCRAELQLRAGNRAAGSYVKKVQEAPSPRCFPELRSLKCHIVLFWNLSVKIKTAACLGVFGLHLLPFPKILLFTRHAGTLSA